MNKLFHAVFIGALALTVGAQAADHDHGHKSGRAAARATNGQTASVRTGRANHAQFSNGPQIHHQSLNTTHHNSTVLRQNHVRASDSHVAVSPRRSSGFTAAHHNSATNGLKNSSVNRSSDRNVRITNNWRGSRFSGHQYSAFRNYHRHYHNRNWYRNNHIVIVFFGGGGYYWNSGYWYPAWGYNPGYSYGYDGPIYGYNNLSPDQVVVNVQSQLQRDGYYSGPIDGDLGPMTRQAIANFQTDRGLAVTSAVDQPTLSSLGLV